MRPLVEPPLFPYQPVHKKFPDLDSSIEFMGGESMPRAWRAFSDDWLDDAEPLFTAARGEVKKVRVFVREP